MPLINVKLIEGVFGDDQKQAMIEKLTDTMVEIEGENMRGVTWVVVEEVKSGDWGIGGQALTTEAVHALGGGHAGLVVIATDTAEPAHRALLPTRAPSPTSAVSASPMRSSATARDDPAAAAVGDRPLALLEAAGPLPRPPLPRRHVRPARQRAIGPS